MARAAPATRAGSERSSGAGFPAPTLQKRQPLVQISPRIMKVAVPSAKQSPLLGQAAELHTVLSRPSARAHPRSIAAWEAHSGWAHLVRGLPIMHDPLAVATMLDPGVVQWRRGTATVELQGSGTYGYTLFAEDPTGPHEIAGQVDANRALDLCSGKVLAC